MDALAESVRLRKEIMRIDDVWTPDAEFATKVSTAPRRSAGVATAAAVMKSSWRTVIGEAFCRDYSLPQSFETVLDTEAYTDAEAEALNRAWCHKMNFFLRHALSSPRALEFPRAGSCLLHVGKRKDVVAT